MERPWPVRYTLGLDLGKLNDYTALAIAEERPASVEEDLPRAVLIPTWADDPSHAVSWLQRWPLGTAYHTIAADVDALVADLAGRRDSRVALYVDGTGVGTAVTEVLRKQPALGQLGLQAITITGGYEAERVAGGWHVPKKELVGVAQVALQRERLKVSPQLPEARLLAEELRNFEVRITAAANATYSHREGQHDDLVLAVALALWGAESELRRRVVALKLAGFGVAGASFGYINYT